MPRVAEWNYGTDNMSHSTRFLATGFECLLSLACASSRAASKKYGLRNIRHCQASHGGAAVGEESSFSCFEGTGVEEVSVPDGVRELCDGCFSCCSSLRV